PDIFAVYGVCIQNNTTTQLPLVTGVQTCTHPIPGSHSPVPQILWRGLPGPRCPAGNPHRRWCFVLSRRWQSTAQEPAACPRPRLGHRRGKARPDGTENARWRQESNGGPRGRRLQADYDRNACENPGRKAVTCVVVRKCASDNQPAATLSMRFRFSFSHTNETAVFILF